MDRLLMQGWSTAFYQNTRPKVRKEIVDGPYVALTFDDGPKGEGTPPILEMLSRYRAHATFFVVGTQCARFPALVARMVDEGHELGNHTYDHHRLHILPLVEVANELERNRRLLHQITGQTAYLFRPPGGRTSAQVQTVVDSLGYTTVFWQLDSAELAPGMTPDRVYHRVVDSIKDGDIVLLHNGDPNILVALPRILETLSSRGYQFVTVSELMQLNGARPVEQTSEPGVDAE